MGYSKRNAKKRAIKIYCSKIAHNLLTFVGDFYEPNPFGWPSITPSHEQLGTDMSFLIGKRGFLTLTSECRLLSSRTNNNCEKKDPQ